MTNSEAATINGDEPVGLMEIAERLGVQNETVGRWRNNSMHGKIAPELRMPDARWWTSGKPVFSWAEIREWAIRTGRMTPGGEPQKLKPGMITRGPDLVQRKDRA